MNGSNNAATQPFIEHIRELRFRLIVSLALIGVFSTLGYVVNDSLMEFIRKPLAAPLFYTSPTGGFSFTFKLCVTFGIICALPVLVYNALRFISPLFSGLVKRTFVYYVFLSVALAVTGTAFAYLISLPAALHFLSGFGGESIQSLITADEYFNFALAYLGGFALLFQLPLILIITNRITPLKPGKLMSLQRFVILGSFIVAAILTPTPDPLNQALMALPIIVLYQFSILFVWLANRRSLLKPLEKQARQPTTHTQLPHDLAGLNHTGSLTSQPVGPKEVALPKRRSSHGGLISDFIYPNVP